MAMRYLAHLGATSVLIAYISCSSSSPDEQTIIGPEGGVAQDSSGLARVEVPPGALEVATSIVISSVEQADVAALPDGWTFGGDIFSFTPHGTKFDTPVTLQVPYRPGPRKLVLVRLDDEDDPTWEVVNDAIFVNGRAIVDSDRFSLLGVASVDDVPETTVEIISSGPGRAIPDIPDVECSVGSSCTFVVPEATLTLTASPAIDRAGLVRWTGAECERAECTLTLTGAPVVVEARFGYELSVEPILSLDDTISGRLVSTPAGIDVALSDFSGPRSTYFEPATEVALMATPSANANVAAWSGDCTASENAGECTTTMNAPQTVGLAVCVCEPMTVKIDGAGVITATPADLLGTRCQRQACNDAETCTLWFKPAQTVTLRASPSTKGRGWSFEPGWTGPSCAGTGDCSVSVTGPSEVTASFTYPVSFERDVLRGIIGPANKNCVFCHNSNPPPAEKKAADTGLLFTGTATAVRRLIVQEPAGGACADALGEPRRINESEVAKSILLRYPLPPGQNGCPTHGLVNAFGGEDDESYLTLRDWIAGGCPSN